MTINLALDASARLVMEANPLKANAVTYNDWTLHTCTLKAKASKALDISDWGFLSMTCLEKLQFESQDNGMANKSFSSIQYLCIWVFLLCIENEKEVSVLKMFSGIFPAFQAQLYSILSLNN